MFLRKNMFKTIYNLFDRKSKIEKVINEIERNKTKSEKEERLKSKQVRKNKFEIPTINFEPVIIEVKNIICESIDQRDD